MFLSILALHIYLNSLYLSDTPQALLDALLCSAMGNNGEAMSVWFYSLHSVPSSLPPLPFTSLPPVVQQYVNEVERLLSEDGAFVCVSHMGPEDALPLLEQYDLDEPFYTPW